MSVKRNPLHEAAVAIAQGEALASNSHISLVVTTLPTVVAEEDVVWVSAWLRIPIQMVTGHAATLAAAPDSIERVAKPLRENNSG